MTCALESIRGAARAVADGLISAATGAGCVACGALLERPTGGGVCPTCWRTLPRITAPWCDVCGLPLARPGDAATAARCRRCRRFPSPIARSRAFGLYEGSLRGVLHAFKYGGEERLAGPLGALMRAAGRDLLHDADAVVPVPLHWWRHQWRGFNQADHLAAELGLPVWRVLRRRRPTRPQVSLCRSARRANVRDALVLRPGARAATRRAASRRVVHRLAPWLVADRPIAHRTLVLVDDVYTTGATLEACARVLRAAGAREVRALTAARAVPGRPVARRR